MPDAKRPLEMNLNALEDAAREVLGSLARLGITPNPASRLPCALKCLSKCLTESAGIMSAQHPDFELACEAIRDVYMFKRILRHPVRSRDDLFIQRLRVAASGGAPSPLDETGNTAARDAQAELFAASTLSAHGLDCVELEEPPDILFRVSGQRFAVAVKRVKGEASVEDRVKSAAEQIARSRRPGIVWLEGTRLINVQNQRIIDPCPDSEFATIANRVLDFLDQEWRPRLMTMLKDSDAIGVIVNGDIVRASHLPFPTVATLHSFHPFVPDARGHSSAWDLIYRRFREGGGTDLTGVQSDLSEWRRRQAADGGGR